MCCTRWRKRREQLSLLRPLLEARRGKEKGFKGTGSRVMAFSFPATRAFRRGRKHFEKNAQEVLPPLNSLFRHCSTPSIPCNPFSRRTPCEVDPLEPSCRWCSVVPCGEIKAPGHVRACVATQCVRARCHLLTGSSWYNAGPWEEERIKRTKCCPGRLSKNLQRSWTVSLLGPSSARASTSCGFFSNVHQIFDPSLAYIDW